MDEEEFEKEGWVVDADFPVEPPLGEPAPVIEIPRPIVPFEPAAYVAPSFTHPAQHAGSQGISWVRASDLLSNGTAYIAGRGIDFEAELARRMHRIPAATRRAVQSRADRLPPLSEFGRPVDPSTLSTRTLGRR